MKVWYWLALLGLALTVGGVIAFNTATVSDSVGLPVNPVGKSVASSVGTDLVRDRIRHPVVRQSFDNGDFRLVIEAVDGWETAGAIAQLYEDDILRWQQPLPHEYGPRFVVVGEQGQVLLLDEFINVASPYALMLLDPAGDQIAQHSFDDISQTLSVSAAELTRQAASGWWISAEPELDTANRQVLVQTGGTTLAVDLSTGELGRCPDMSP